MKDELLSRDPETGREQATISYEYDFEVPGTILANGEETTGSSIFIPWSSLKPTYRGKERKDAKPLDLTSIKRVSIMMRRYAIQVGSAATGLLSYLVSSEIKRARSLSPYAR